MPGSLYRFEDYPRHVFDRDGLSASQVVSLIEQFYDDASIGYAFSVTKDNYAIEVHLKHHISLTEVSDFWGAVLTGTVESEYPMAEISGHLPTDDRFKGCACTYDFNDNC